ncbi:MULTISPECIES: trypsin-like serine peptidase [Pseudomonas]|uniref:trypsin-like serine peptidase n=1 Tax=Pseudomonas TaxID=286 RepID=UPI000ABF41D6|nr:MULTISPECIES: serine protease [Pseudomonas]WHS56314.1 serine protease [Pseudomonas brassicacearum]
MNMTVAKQLRSRLRCHGNMHGGESLVADALSEHAREQALARLAAQVDEGDPEARKLLENARLGLDYLNTESGTLTMAMRVGIEAIILADGSRPALLVSNDSIDFDDPLIGSWLSRLSKSKPLLRDALSKIARIAMPLANGTVQTLGTGFLIGTGLLATNRHVLQEMAVLNDSGTWRFKDDLIIDFGGEYHRTHVPAALARPVTVVRCGTELIQQLGEPRHLDFALIEIQACANHRLPTALQVFEDSDAQVFKPGAPVVTIGFPAKPSFGMEDPKALFKLFKGVFDVKRLSPGLVGDSLGQVPGDSQPPRCFSHDASTLGGNSGGCVIGLDDTWQVIGLHFGGRSGEYNLAHDIRAVLETYS